MQHTNKLFVRKRLSTTRWYGGCRFILFHNFLRFVIIVWCVIYYLLPLQCVAVLPIAFNRLPLNTLWCSWRTWRIWRVWLSSALGLLEQHWQCTFLFLIVYISRSINVVFFIVVMTFCVNTVVRIVAATTTTTAGNWSALWCIAWYLLLIYAHCAFTVLTFSSFIVVLGKTKFIKFGKAWNKSYS